MWDIWLAALATAGSILYVGSHLEWSCETQQNNMQECGIHWY